MLVVVFFLGLSATFEGQLKKILETLTVAIQQASPTKDMSNVSPEAIMKKIEATLEEKAQEARQVSSPETSGIVKSIGPKRSEKAKKKKVLKEDEDHKWCDP